jgi:hypothetical protein
MSDETKGPVAQKNQKTRPHVEIRCACGKGLRLEVNRRQFARGWQSPTGEILVSLFRHFHKGPGCNIVEEWRER